MKELIDIIASMVDVNDLYIKLDSVNNTIEITNKIDDQAIIIQSNEEGIWVRLRARCPKFKPLDKI